MDFSKLTVRVRGKGGKSRVIPMAESVRIRIRSYLAERRKADLGGERETDRLFVRTNGKPLNRQALYHLVDRWLAWAGVSPPLGEGPHLFRHTYAVWQLYELVPLHVLSQLMGHEHLSSTAVYTRVAPIELRDGGSIALVNESLDQLGEVPSWSPA